MAIKNPMKHVLGRIHYSTALFILAHGFYRLRRMEIPVELSLTIMLISESLDGRDVYYHRHRNASYFIQYRKNWKYLWLECSFLK
jgi:hypothetical protein